MGGFVAGGIAVLVGACLAAATAFGVVSTVSATPSQPESGIVDYGSTTSE